MTKFLSILALAFAFSGQFSLAEEEKAAPKPVRDVRDFRGIFGAIQNGDYSFLQYDKGLLQKEYLDILKQRSDKDVEYVQSAVRDIENSFVQLVRDTTLNPGGLQSLSVAATTQNMLTSASDFVQALNRYKTAKLELEVKINSFASISSALPSLRIKAEGSGLEEVPQYNNIKWDTIQKNFANALTQLNTEVSNLPHIIVMPNGIKHVIAKDSGKGLALEIKGPMLNDAELAKIQQEIQDAYTWGWDATKALNNLTVFSYQTIQNFLVQYGTRERWRHWDELPEKEREARAADAKLIADAFFVRSYLRYTFGMPIGAIGIEYKTRVLQLDALFSPTNLMFNQEAVWEEKDFMKYAKNYRLALERVDVRARKILDGELGWLQTAENLTTWIAGNTNLARAIQNILFVMAADFYEERLMTQLDGSAKMRTRLKERYLGTREERDYYKTVVAEFNLDGKTPGKLTGINPQSFKGQFVNTMKFFKLKEVQISKARVQEAELEVALGENPVAKERQNRVSDLFDEDEE